MSLWDFFRKLFGKEKKKKAKHKKHRKRKPKTFREKHKPKTRKKPAKKRPKKHKENPKKFKKPSKTKIKSGKKKIPPKQKAKKRKKPKPTKRKPEKKPKERKVKYGIPEGHKHEAELKVAEKRSDIEEFYKTPEGRVGLKIQEKSTTEPIKVEPKHNFHFKKKSDKETIDNISKILKRKKSQDIIVTNLDILLDIVNSLGKVRINHVAESLKMKEKEVEELAGILEGNNLIEIHYPAFGKIELKKKKEEKNE